MFRLCTRLVFAFFPICLFSVTALAQISRIEPAQPRQQNSITISYNPAAPGAKFSLKDEVYAVARFEISGFGQFIAARLKVEEEELKCEMAIRDGASSVSVHFIASKITSGIASKITSGIAPDIALNTGPHWELDEQAFTSAMISGADGKPARGALLGKISSPQYQQLFAREIENYTDEYSAYRAKWIAAENIEPARLGKLIKADLRKLDQVQVQTAELLYAISCGHLMLGDEAGSRATIKRLLAKFPDDNYAALAIKDYESQVANRGLSGNEPREVAQLKLAFIERNPQSQFARESSMALAEDKTAALELIEAVCRRWTLDEPENPLPAFVSALAYQNQYKNHDQAASLIDQAIEGLRDGRLRLLGDINGQQTARLLPLSHLIKGEIAFRQGKTELALASAAVAKTLAPDDWKPYLLEARIHQAIGQRDRAEAAFIEAWRRGSQEAGERLKERYKERLGTLAGFDDYLTSQSKSTVATKNAWWLPAPQFNATALDGKSFDPSALQGKIVVLSFWFIECGPCLKEIPQLNRLVDVFRTRNIIFLAPTPDSAEALKEFLKKTPFNYQIVPSAERMIEQFNVSHFPSHIVIDGDGQIEAVITGGGEQRFEELKRILLQMMK